MRSNEAMALELVNILASRAERADVHITVNPGCFTLRGSIEAALLLARAIEFGHSEVNLLPCEVYP